MGTLVKRKHSFCPFIWVALEQELCLPSRSEYIRILVSSLGLPSEYDYWLREYSPNIPLKSITTSNNRRPGLWWMVFVVEKETQLHLDLNNEIELKKINSNQPFHRLASQSQLAFMSSPAPLSRRPFGFCRGFCAIWAPVCPELEFFAICSVGRWTQQCFCASWGDLELDFFSLALEKWAHRWKKHKYKVL